MVETSRDNSTAPQVRTTALPAADPFIECLGQIELVITTLKAAQPPAVKAVQQAVDKMTEINFRPFALEKRESMLERALLMLQLAGAKAFVFKDGTWKRALSIYCCPGGPGSKGTFIFRGRDHEDLHKKTSWPRLLIVSVAVPDAEIEGH